MSPPLLAVLTAAITAADVPVPDKPPENPVYKELVEKGIQLSDGKVVKLSPPILADGLDADAQRAALKKIADPRNSLDDFLKPSFYSPVMVKVRTVNPTEGEKPVGRTVDAWFVVHGDWNILTSKDFLEAMAKPEGEGQSRVVSKSGALTDEEMAKRKLAVATKDGCEERFVYATFSLFERVEISSTRHAVMTRGKDNVLAAGVIDPRFDKDAEFPNQWRPLLRDAMANVKPGPAHPFTRAGGYAKITRLKSPANAVFIECHVAYEEDYGWFDGVNLVKQKVPAMVQEKVRTFRRKLTVASEKKEEKK
jgi:hypothetical protein